MTNEYNPATPPWLLPQSIEPSARSSVGTEARNDVPEAPSRPTREDSARPAPEVRPAPDLQVRPEQEQRVRAPQQPPAHTPATNPAHAVPENQARPMGEPQNGTPRPQEPARSDTRFAEPPPWQRANFGPQTRATPINHEQANNVAPQSIPPQVQQPQPQHARPSQPQVQQAAYQPNVDQLPRERPEIGTDGTVRRVPFQEDRVAQIYQAPPDVAPSGPVYGWTPPGQQQTGAWQPPAQNAPAQSVNDLSLLRRAKRPPRSGWRLAVHKASGGTINPGESNADVAFRELADRVNQPVRGDYRIAILSLKGGVGKTTTTVGLGSTFASLRGDRVIAIDANPDLGTLAHRVPKQTNSTVRSLLDDGDIHRYSDVRAHTSQAPSRLEVLASEQDPAVSEAFSEADYRSSIDILQAYYNIILTDCGTGLMHSAMTGVLDMASSLVLVTSPAIDGARSASATLDWLEHHGYGKLVERTVVVVNSSRRGASSVDIEQLRRLFLDRTRAVQVVPFDDHLAEGAEIDLDLVSKPTRRALLELAAIVADDFQRLPQ